MNKKYSSANDTMSKLLRINQNVMELLTKMDQSLNTNESFVTAKSIDSTGKQIETQIPSTSFYVQKLEQINNMLKQLIGFNNNAASMKVDNNIFKKLLTVDVNREPRKITGLNPVNIFKAEPNWIFDSLLNPKISVEVDLTGKIDDTCKHVLSRRYIITFEQEIVFDQNGNEQVQLTNEGKTRLAEFELNFNNKADININSFVNWLDSPGLVNRVDDTLIDEDLFRLQPARLQYKGDFTITSSTIDQANNKLWYTLTSLSYQDLTDPNNPINKDLKIGDKVKINPANAGESSATIYKVVEISTITSEFRVRFERVFGEEPLSIRLNAISIYSDTVPRKTVNISVGHDEYSVLFLKPYDEYTNILAIDWSLGVGFYSNELRLDTANGEPFSEYYIKNVYDYGMVLDDLVTKKVPNYYGIKPNAPILDPNNFKVVQINSHLTNTVEAEKIRDLHNKKNTLNSQIAALQTQLANKNKQIAQLSPKSLADKKTATDELNSITSKLNAVTETKNTIVAEILANKKNINKVPPVYHLKGVFPMPLPQKSLNTIPQEVVQFEIWYRRLSKSGNEKPLININDVNNLAAQQLNPNTTVINSNNKKTKTINATLSNWEKYKTDTRKRTQDQVTKEWFWEVVDVTDANTPAINQVDIPISPGEIIEIKIKAFSEVGWPETPLESEFSNIISIPFPDDLDSILNEDDFVLKEAQGEQIKVEFEKSLEAKGLTKHLSTSFINGDSYYPHKMSDLDSGFRDNNNNIINAYEYIIQLTNRISTLEELINRSKGILEIYLIEKNNKTKINNNAIIQRNINLEDYMTKTKIGLVSNPVNSIGRTYENTLLQINDYSLEIKNVAQNASLALLSYRKYGKPAGQQQSEFAYNETGPNPANTPITPMAATYGIQALWIQPDSTMLFEQAPSVPGTPKLITQKDNQFIWQQIKTFQGDYICNTHSGQTANRGYSITSGVFNTQIYDVIKSNNYNVGMMGSHTVATGSVPIPEINKLNDPKNWESLNPLNTGSTVNDMMGSTIHPVINSLTDITDTSAQLQRIVKPGDANSIIIPINIFAKPYLGTGVHNGTINLPFDETTDWTPFNLINANNISKDVKGYMVLTFASGINDKIKVGDKVVLNLTHANVISETGKVLNVIATSATTITLNSKPALLSTPIQESNLVAVEQVHKKYVSNAANWYNVLARNESEKYVRNYVEFSSNFTNPPAPVVHNKSLRFYTEDENSIRPFEFQLTFNIQQYKINNLSAQTRSTSPSI